MYTVTRNTHTYTHGCVLCACAGGSVCSVLTAVRILTAFFDMFQHPPSLTSGSGASTEDIRREFMDRRHIEHRHMT